MECLWIRKINIVKVSTNQPHFNKTLKKNAGEKSHITQSHGQIHHNHYENFRAFFAEIKKKIIKFVQKTLNRQSNHEENRARGFTLSDFNAVTYKGLVIQTVRY